MSIQRIEVYDYYWCCKENNYLIIPSALQTEPTTRSGTMTTQRMTTRKQRSNHSGLMGNLRRTEQSSRLDCPSIKGQLGHSVYSRPSMIRFVSHALIHSFQPMYDFQTTLRTVSLGLYAGMTSVALLGILWAIGLLIFNWVFRHSR